MTTYAYFDGPTYIGEYNEDQLPGSAQRRDTGQWVSDLHNADPAIQRATGWYKITNTPRPPDTQHTTTTRVLEYTTGNPITILEVWRQRIKTPEELAATNATTITNDTRTAIDALRTSIDTMRQLLDTPNTTLNTTPAPAIKALARECIDTMRATIRLARLATQTTDTTTTDYGTGNATTTHQWMIIL